MTVSELTIKETEYKQGMSLDQAVLSILFRYPVLHSLVFGEGVVNDATAIVLLSATASLSGDSMGFGALCSLLASFARLFALSLLLGVASGLTSAAIIK